MTWLIGNLVGDVNKSIWRGGAGTVISQAMPSTSGQISAQTTKKCIIVGHQINKLITSFDL